MSEAEKTIIFESNKRYPPGSTTNNLWFVFREGAKFGYQLAQEELSKLGSGYQPINTVDTSNPPRQPSQDELWEEFRSECVVTGVFRDWKAKKRYRITRI